MFYTLLFIERVLMHSHGHAPSHVHHEPAAPSAFMKPGRPSGDTESGSSHHGSATGGGADEPLLRRISRATWRLRHAVLVMCAISVHSILSGIALGMAETLKTFWALFAGIAAHKVFDGFVVGAHAVKGDTSRGELFVLGIPTLLSEPIGILIGMRLTGISPWVTSVFLALVAGCFIYLGACEIVIDEIENATPQPHCHGDPSLKGPMTRAQKAKKFGAMMLGVLTFVGVAGAIAHAHGGGGHSHGGGGDAHAGHGH
jgi:zinc transporter ZupT